MSLLITPTLLDAYDWLNKAPRSWKKKAFDDFSNKLHRTKWDPTPAIKRGIDFEKKVYANCNRDLDTFKSSEIFKEVCNDCKGGDFQKVLKKVIMVDGREFLLYGKTDAWFPTVIKDIKTTKNYKGQSKYLGGWQHKVYCYIDNNVHFEYLVVEWSDEIEEDDKLVPAEVFKIHYTMEDRAAVKEEIVEQIREMMQFIDTDDILAKAYYKTFNKYG